jgi:hypothetical protein
MKQVEDEYFKLTEIHNNNNTSYDQLIPPTPLKGLPFSTTAEGINSNGLVNDSVRNTTVLFTPKEEYTEDSTTINIRGPPKEANKVK